MQVIHEEGGEAETTIGNPCPVIDESTSRIWMPFCRDNDRVLVMFSDDDGRSWSKPVEITRDVKADDWNWYATGPGVGIQLQRGKYKGRMVIPCDHGIDIDATTSAPDWDGREPDYGVAVEGLLLLEEENGEADVSAER